MQNMFEIMFDRKIKKLRKFLKCKPVFKLIRKSRRGYPCKIFVKSAAGAIFYAESSFFGTPSFFRDVPSLGVSLVFVISEPEFTPISLVTPPLFTLPVYTYWVIIEKVIKM